MTKEELRQAYAALSVQELLEILDNKFDYTDLAVAVAIEALSARKVSEDDIRAYKALQFQRAEELIKRNVVYGLSVVEKNIFYFCWLPLLTFPFRQNYREDGHVLKTRQANYYSLTGFIFCALAALLALCFALSEGTFFALWLIGFLPVYYFDESFNRQRQINRMRELLETAAPDKELKKSK